MQTDEAIEHAKEYDKKIRRIRDDALRMIGEEERTKTELLTDDDYTTLIRPVAWIHGYPPDYTRADLGFDDASVPSCKLWIRMGCQAAVEAGTGAHADAAPCGAHSANKEDPTFPRRRQGDKTIDWDECGCSNRIAKEVYDSLTSSQEVKLEMVKRTYHVEPRYRDDYVSEHLDTVLASSANLDGHSDSASFSHYITVSPHTSLCLYAKPDRTTPDLAKVQVTQTVFDESVFVAGQRVDVGNQRVLLHRYIARMLDEKGKKRFYVPPLIQSAGKLLRSDLVAPYWDMREVGQQAGIGFVKRAERYEVIARDAGVGAGTGFLERVILGWKVALQRAAQRVLSRMRFPLPADPNSTSLVVAATGTPDLRFSSLSNQEHTVAATNLLRFPLPADPNSTSLVIAATGTPDLRFSSLSNQEHTVAAANLLRFPLPADPSSTSLVVAATGTPDLRFASAGNKEHIATLNTLLWRQAALRHCLVCAVRARRRAKEVKIASIGGDGLVYCNVAFPVKGKVVIGVDVATSSITFYESTPDIDAETSSRRAFTATHAPGPKLLVVKYFPPAYSRGDDDAEGTEGSLAYVVTTFSDNGAEAKREEVKHPLP
ncbi:hypothetical protein JCM10296v2_001742 [Rhodotorula toruloides]